MRVLFKKIGASFALSYKANSEGAYSVELEAMIEPVSRDSALYSELSDKAVRLYRLHGVLRGSIELLCHHSGEPFTKSLDEELELYLSDGVCTLNDGGALMLDVIEFLEGYVDLSYLVASELELIAQDFHTK